MDKRDVLIIGGGIFGLLLARKIQRCTPLSVTVLEAGVIGKAGVSAHSGGMLRVFHSDPYLADQSLYSLGFYREFYADFVEEQSALTILNK